MTKVAIIAHDRPNAAILAQRTGDDDGVHAGYDARHVLLVPVRAVAVLVPVQRVFHRADGDNPPPDGEGAVGPRARGHRSAADPPDAPPRLARFARRRLPWRGVEIVRWIMVKYALF